MKEQQLGVDWSKCKGEGNFRQRSFRWLLQEEADLAGRRVVDLGAGPCAFSRIAAEFGADVTAVDGRDERVPDDVKANRIVENGRNERPGWLSWLGKGRRGNRAGRAPDETGCGDIRFLLADVRSVDLEPYDLVMIFGLLYHLEIEDQMELLRRCKGKTVLIDTMLCCPNLVTRYPGEEWQCVVKEQGGFEGWVYPEKDNAMAAIGNGTSFWHTEESYSRLFSDCRFEDVTAYRPMYLAKDGMRSFYKLAPGVS